MAFWNFQTNYKEGNKKVFYLKLLKDGRVRQNAIYIIIKRGIF